MSFNALNKRPPRLRLEPIVTTSPFELMAIDFLHLEKSRGGYKYILVLMDHFTRYAQALATRNKSAKTVSQKLYDDFILRFGFPFRIHHDQEGEFENCLHRELEKLCGVEQTCITPYHPKGTIKLSASTRHFWECSVPCQRPRNHVGQNT